VGPYELNWETQQYKCWISQLITFSLLATLQAVNLFWLFLILRIAKNYVYSSVAVDERSEYEDEDEEEAEAKDKTGPEVRVNGVPIEASKETAKETANGDVAPRPIVNGKKAANGDASPRPIANGKKQRKRGGKKKNI